LAKDTGKGLYFDKIDYVRLFHFHFKNENGPLKRTGQNVTLYPGSSVSNGAKFSVAPPPGGGVGAYGMMHGACGWMSRRGRGQLEHGVRVRGQRAADPLRRRNDHSRHQRQLRASERRDLRRLG